MRFAKWFKPQLSAEEYHLQVSEQLGALAKKLSTDSKDEVTRHTAACLNMLAVLCGTGDKERLFEAGHATSRLADEALKQYAEPEPVPEETLRRLIERGIDIACSAMYARNWKVVTEGLSKLILLDDLAKKVASGEEVLKKQTEDVWDDVING
jgi:hypothetical protein